MKAILHTEYGPSEEAATIPVIGNTALHFIRDMGNVVITVEHKGGN